MFHLRPHVHFARLVSSRVGKFGAAIFRHHVFVSWIYRLFALLRHCVVGACCQ